MQLARTPRLRLSLVTLAALSLGAPLAPSRLGAQVNAKPAPPAVAGAPHDGQHDFDFMVGTWKAHLSRLDKPLTGSKNWIEFDGTQITSSVWGGRGTMDDFHVDSPETNTHIDGMTLRLYNPQSHQWYIYWSNATHGVLDWPPVVGEWKNGRGEFYDQELRDGRMIFVRYVWSDVTPSSARFEQSFSIDGGRTWEPNWISTIARVK
jgi:hypothetical protein